MSKRFILGESEQPIFTQSSVGRRHLSRKRDLLGIGNEVIPGVLKLQIKLKYLLASSICE